MRLSEAILLGIGGVKNRRNYFLMQDGGNQCGCAIGTALWAKGYTWSYEGIKDCYREWPWTRTVIDGISIASHISSRHFGGESRESIAAWVAEQEVRLGVVDTQVVAEVKDGEHATA